MAQMNLSVVIIDDDPVMCEMEGDAIRRKFPDAVVTTYNTGEEALSGIMSRPDLVILDYQLDSVKPDAMNGIQILTKLKARYPDLPVIFMSSQDRMEVASNTIKYGAYDYIVKGETAYHKLELAVRQLASLRELRKSHGTQKS